MIAEDEIWRKLVQQVDDIKGDKNKKQKGADSKEAQQQATVQWANYPKGHEPKNPVQRMPDQALLPE